METGCEIARCSPRLEPLVQRHPVTPNPKLGSNGYAQIIAVSVGLIVPNIRAIRVRLAQVIYPLWDCSTTFVASVRLSCWRSICHFLPFVYLLTARSEALSEQNRLRRQGEQLASRDDKTQPFSLFQDDP